MTADYGRFGDDFEIGQIYRHAIRKTITESDNNLFCLLTMNHHPIHLDREFAKSSRFGDVVVVGTLILSLAVGISVADLSGMAVAALSYDAVEHISPVRVGDTLSVTSEIIDVRHTSGGETTIVSTRSTVVNQHGHDVLRFERAFMVPRHA